MNIASNPFYLAEPGFDRLYIFGAGGAGREIAWLVEQCWGRVIDVEFLVDQVAYLSPPVNGVAVGLLADVVSRPNDRFVVGVGDGSLRRKAAKYCANIGLQPITLVHPRVEMSSKVGVGEGSVICAGSIVTTDVAIGMHVYVNVGCTISHNVRIGNYSTLSPGVHISGYVEIGCNVLIGTGANIINGSVDDPIVIGDGAVIAAGACVTKSVADRVLVAGVPAVRKS